MLNKRAFRKIVESWLELVTFKVRMSKIKQSKFLLAYQSCHESFLRYCSVLAHRKMDCEDLVQDVLLTAYTHFDTIKDKDQLLHYLIRAARNRSISTFRKQKYRFRFSKSQTTTFRITIYH